jgi:hypothetical protein
MRSGILALAVLPLFLSGHALAQSADAPARAEGQTEARKAALPSTTETISGSVTLVRDNDHQLFLAAPNGTSYHFLVNKTARIMIDGRSATPDDLSHVIGKKATVAFANEGRQGNLAASIVVTG